MVKLKFQNFSDIINFIEKDQGHIWQIVLPTVIEALDNR